MGAMGYRGYGVQGVWAMEHRGVMWYRVYRVQGIWGTWVMGHRGQWGTGPSRSTGYWPKCVCNDYKGRSHMTLPEKIRIT